MERYRVLFRKSAAGELGALSGKTLGRVVEKIRGLATDPRPPGCRKLAAAEKYRVRQGDLRIVYSVEDDTKTVIVVKIGHRKDVYR
jgi:mRNA interferase RelE/StbE